MTFRLLEASIIVGESVSASSGSTSAPSSGCTSFARAIASSGGGASPRTASRKPRASGISSFGGSNSASAVTYLAAFTSALSAMPGIDACPLRPCTRSRNGADIFSAVAHR